MLQPKMEVRLDGTKHWFLNGKRHREDGPAVERSDGEKHWLLNGKRHREDGPAIEYADGTRFWCLNGELVSWKEVLRNANGDLEKQCRILIYALTTP
jgi:hypothetical protein